MQTQFNKSDYFSECTNLMQKVSSLRSNQQLTEARSFQRRALALALAHLPGSGYDHIIPMLCHDIATNLLYDREYDNAMIMLDHAREYMKLYGQGLPPPACAGRARQFDFTQGQIHVLRKEYALAEPLLISAAHPDAVRTGSHWVPEAYKLLADCYAAADNFSLAEEYYKKAMERHASLDALEAYHALLIRMNQTASAEEIAKRIEAQKAGHGISHFCGNGEMQRQYWLTWEPTLPVTQQDYDQLNGKFPV
jgi:tetratricopeptide (TPR) repeat protein